MALSKKELYRRSNEEFLHELKKKSGVGELEGGILYEVIKSSDKKLSPNINSIVTVNYSGKLINGKEFDSTIKRNCPEAFRLRDVIDGWQIALQNMNLGDRWIIYIPYDLGYGNKSNGDIPAFSTLVFDVELRGVM